MIAMATATSSHLVDAVAQFNAHVSQRLFGGPAPLKMAWVINAHKLLTPVLVLSLMLAYNNFSAPAWIYLALHGAYALSWLFKHGAFADPRWEVKVTLGGAAFTFLLLGTYWIAPVILVAGLSLLPAPLWLLALAVAFHTLGVVTMVSADCQKFFVLRASKSLLTDGVFRFSRHPNYLGEMAIYASYALIAGHWLPWVVLAYWWVGVFFINMCVIEASLSRYPGWAAYRSHTAFLVPFPRLRARGAA